MAQRPKEHVREAIVAAAATLFAELGYGATTMAAVADRAGSSIGNVYRYFQNKDELFSAVLPAPFAADLKRMTRERIEALGAARDIGLLSPAARYHVLAEELLDHCIENRERVVILLARAEGTPFASFADDFARALVSWALAYAEKAWPELPHTHVLRWALHAIYTNYLASLAGALATLHREAQIREAVDHLTAHHQGGLKHLFETASGGRR